MTQALATAQPNGQNRKQRRLAARQAKRNGLARGAIASPPGGDDPRVQRGIECHSAGDLESAERLYREALAEDPDNARARFRLGALLAQHKRNDEAVIQLERARDLAPGFPSTYNNLAAVYTAAGRTDDARDCLHTGLKLNPAYADAHKNLGALEYRLDNFEAAIKSLKRGLDLAPEDAPKQRLLGLAYAQRDRLKAAAARLEKAVALDPKAPEYRAELAVLLVMLKDFDAALPHVLACFEDRVPNAQVQGLLWDVLSNIELDSYMPALDHALITCFESEVFNLRAVARAAGVHLVVKYYGEAQFESKTDAESGQAVTKMHLDGILGDRLLILLLQKTVCVEPCLELLLVPLRQQLLVSARRQGALSPAVMLFMAAFAIQCHNNSYAFFITPEERAELAQLTSAIGEALQDCTAPTPALEIMLALYGMYEPLHHLAGFEKLLAFPTESWSRELWPLVERTLINPKDEEALKPTIPAFGSIQDETSKAVRSQYEENPYPRWVMLPEHPAGTFRHMLVQHMPWRGADFAVEEPTRGLIAGCGTGQHPIGVAMQIPNCAVTAVDLSLASLGYAKRMAKRYRVDNISFRHGDLLDVAELGTEFDFVDSTGVLHHMRDPDQGLESLLRVLRPGGLLRLGLYSQLARQGITEGRRRIKELNLEPTTENIRTFRHMVLMGQELSDWDFSNYQDLYDLDSFRDLVFHVQEHQYTIPRLEDMFARHGLEFLGFIKLHQDVYDAYRRRFPDDPGLCNLTNWQAFEIDNPDTFIAMYCFWCRKPAA